MADIPFPVSDDTPEAKYWRAEYPQYSYCGRCGHPWAVVISHPTQYAVTTVEEGIEVSGCFVLCETCWSILETVEQRMPYYVTWYEWLEERGRPALTPDEKIDLYEAVKAQSGDAGETITIVEPI